LIRILPISRNQPIPYDLLLLADPDRGKIDQYLPESVSFAAYQNDKVVGICVLRMHADLHFEVVNIAVEQAYRGQGIGKSLLLYAIDQARYAGGASISIATGNSSTGQVALYQKVGFVIVEIIKDYFVNNYPEPIWENGVQCRDRVLMKMAL
jgi:ribosomal protein S18 acetylase RimI-like enzyme